MKAELIKRLERVEQKTDTEEGITAIFIHLCGKEKDQENISGWFFNNSEDKKTEVHRLASESLEDLGKRAVDLARFHICKERIPLLIQLI